MKRVWIYQSSRFLTADEIAQIEDILQEFVVQWTAHGNQLAGSFEIRYSLFILLMVDEEKAMVTGCSIDKSTHLLKEIEKALNISLFDRLQVAYRKTKEDDIQLASQDTFREWLAAGVIAADSVIVFNNTVASAAELETKWEVPVKESWHARLL